LFDKEKIDSYFNWDSQLPAARRNSESTSRHTRFVRLAKLLLPSIAAVLIGLLLVFPSLKKDTRDFKLDITRPKQGELEKLHVENTVFYITDKDNKVNNFLAQNIDETAPGSKIIKLTAPEGLIPVDFTNWANIKAPTGYYDQNANILSLTDNVEIFYSEGMTLQTQEAAFDFNQSKGYGTTRVHADGYFGSLVADGFEFSGKDDILIFIGHNDITIKEESLKGR
jgi:hypothetical protein